jgi:hypothetical protein
MIVFKKKITMSSAIKKLQGCHVESMASLSGSLDYVAKDGDVTERGTCPMLQKDKGDEGREYYQNLFDLARDDRIEKIDPEAQLRMGRTLRLERDESSKKRNLPDTEIQHEWYYGAAGTGKSRKALQENPDAYLKMCNKWWDGYNDDYLKVLTNVLNIA